MKTADFFKTVSSAKLNETFEKNFGGKINLDKYSREQLEDMRNKLRTRVFQQEGSAGYNDLLTNETYQKDQAMLQLLNTRIKEMLGEDIKKLKDKMVELSEAKKGVRAPKYTKKAKGTQADRDYDGDGNIESSKDEVWGSRAKAAKKAGKPFEEGAKPDFLDMDKDGNKKEPMKKAVKDKKMKEGFPTVASAKAEHEKNKTTGKFDKKDTGTGTQYTRKASTFTDGGDDQDVKAAKKKAKSTAEGKDEFGKGKNFAKISKAAGGGEKGDRIAGAVRAEKIKKAGGKVKYAKESVNKFRSNVRLVNESLAYYIAEDEEGKAKAITAASDIVNDFTSWMQRVGQYQTKAIIELADAIRADFGQAEAEAFKQSVGPALAATLDVLTQQREAISGAVAVLAGEAAPTDTMGMEPGMEPGMPPEPGMDAAAPDEMNPEVSGDEFGAADAAAGTGTTGREVRESKADRRARKLAESHSIMAKLAK